MKARLSLKISAGARTTGFAGRYGESWKLKVAAPPVDGKANAEIVKFLARFTGVAPSSVSIVSGTASTRKIVEIDGLGDEALNRAILENHGTRSVDT